MNDADEPDHGEVPEADGGHSVEPPELEEETLDVLVEHAELRWQAEEENARRLSGRRGQLLTLIGALLGLGLFQVGRGGLGLGELRPRPVAVLIGVGLAVAVVFLLWALKDLLRVRRHPDEAPSPTEEDAEGGTPLGLASASLQWPADLTPGGAFWGALDPAEAKQVRFWSLERATTRLHSGNTRSAQAHGAAQERLFVVALALGFVLLCYMLTQGGPDSSTPDSHVREEERDRAERSSSPEDGDRERPGGGRADPPEARR